MGGRFGLRLRVSGLAVSVSIVVGVLPIVRAQVCEAATSFEFIPPVSGRISRHFQSPISRFGAGHRGIDFDVAAGTVVVASNGGRVTFAGPVADDGLFVTIAHDRAIETTYSFLSRVDVSVGQSVRRGAAIGLSGAGHPGKNEAALHFGAKLAGVYIDPELLLFANLDDISEVIALAPLAEPGGYESSGGGGGTSDYGGGGRGGGLGGGGVGGSGERDGLFLTLGQGVSNFGKFLMAAPGAAFALATSGVKAIGTIGGKALDLAGRATDGLIEGAKRLGSAVASGLVSAAKAIGGLAVQQWRGGRAIATSLGKGVWTGLVGALKTWAQWQTDLQMKVRSAVTAGARFVGSQLAGGWQALRQVAGVVWGGLKQTWRDTQALIKRGLEQVQALIKASIKLGRQVWSVLKEVPAKLWQVAKFRWAKLKSDVSRMIRLQKSLARTAGRALLGILKMPFKTLKHLATFGAGMTMGLIEQLQCSRKGGAALPKLPTKADVNRGVRAPKAPNDHIVVAVAGIGSSSGKKNGKMTSDASIYQLDFRTLGYDESSIYHFSYKGLQDNGGTDPYKLHAPYEPEDTYKSIRDSAAVLGRQIAEIHRRFPQKKIDLVAHSQGGVVARYYIADFYKEEEIGVGTIANLVSIASPHSGADAAEIGPALQDSLAGRAALRHLDSFAYSHHLPPPTAEAATQLAEGSDFLSLLNARWNPRKVNTTTIGGTFDYVVAAPHTSTRGAQHFTPDLAGLGAVFQAHGAIVNDPATRGYLYNALAGRSSTCTSLRNAFAVYGPGQAIETTQDLLVRGVDSVVDLSSWRP